MNFILQDYESDWPNIWPKNKCRSLWPIFHGPVILPYILTICCMNIIFWDYESVWHDIWPQNKCKSLWPIFHGPVILPYISKTIWYMNSILRNFESVWPNVWPKINMGDCYLYISWSSDFALYLENCSVAEHRYFGTTSQYDPTSDLKIGCCDLYFMVQWFCLISWRPFDGWTLYFVIMSQCNVAFAQKQCRSQWSIFSWSSDFALYLEYNG